MANHKSAIKRIRSDYIKNQHNKYLHKTVRTSIKKLRTGQVTLNQKELAKVFSLIDKLVKNNIFHKNKGANLKSQLANLNDEKISKTKEKKKANKKTSSNVKKSKKLEIVESIEESPIEESPVEESSVEESPVEESPVEESPVEESSIEESPDKQ